VLIGEVNYINYETQGFAISNAMNFIMHKRLSFAHERELRAIFWEMDGCVYRKLKPGRSDGEVRPKWRPNL